MTERFFQLYERLILNRANMVLLLLALLLGFLGYHAPTFKLDASADALVLEGDADLEYFREFAKRYATQDFLVITYTPQQDLLAEAVLQRLTNLADELGKLEGVANVMSVLNVPLLQSPNVNLSELGDGLKTLQDEGVDRELVREEFNISPIYANMLVSPDGKTTALQVNIETDEQYRMLLENRERLRDKQLRDGLSGEERLAYANAQRAFKDYSVEFNQHRANMVAEVRLILDKYKDHADIHLGGVSMIASDMIDFVKKDLLVFGSGILVFVIILLSVIFRRLRWVAIPLLICVSTCVAMLGFLTLVDWRMTVVSSNFVALLLIITLAISVHLVVRYRELFAGQPELSQRELVMETVRSMLKPCTYTALTTIVAFSSLVVSGIRPVIDFGWMMTMGTAVALLMVFIILPAILVLLKKSETAPAVAGSTVFTHKLAVVADRYGKWILTISALLAVLCGIGISRLEVENRFIDFFDTETEIYQGMELVDAQLGGTIPLEIIITASGEAAEEEFESDDEFENFDDEGEKESAEDDENFEEVDADADEDIADFDDEDDDFGDDFGDDEGAESSVWFTRQGLDDIERIHDTLEAMPETGKVLSLATLYKLTKELTGADIDDVQLAVAKGNLPPAISDIMIRPYLIDERNETRISIRVKETSRELNRAEFLQKVRTYLIDEAGLQAENVQLSGLLVLYNNMLQSLYSSQILTIAAVFSAIMVMFVVLFGSLKIAILGILPNMLAAAMVLGGMGLAGIPLDMMTITIAAIAIGIGVDNAVHYLHRFRSEFPQDRDYIATMYRCHESIGRALYYTSITVIIGFSILALSNFRPSIYFGLLTGAAMLGALLGALLLLPQLLLLFKPFGDSSAIEGKPKRG
ncbi:MAG: efflux RND transporter permease subunit [Pseudomonadales bacterium]